MRDVFACTKCNAIHEITRLQQQPILPPRCQVCFASLPPSEMGDWLAYQRAEPEWSLSEWLGVEDSQYSVPSPRRAFVELAQSKMRTADPVLRPSRLQPSSLGSTRVFDER